MALAILRLDDSDLTSAGGGYGLVLDTGTSTHYRIHLGKEVRREEGMVLIDGAYWSSPLRVNPRAGRHVDTRTNYTLDASLVTEPGTIVQLESCRSPDGRGRAWSRPVRLPGYRPARRRDRVMTMSMSSARTLYPVPEVAALAPPRMAHVCSAVDVFSRPASIGDLISEVVHQAAPIVLDIINKSPALSSTTDPTASLLSTVLKSVLGALSQTQPPVPAVPAPTAAPTPAAVPAPAPAAPATPAAPASTPTAPVKPASFEEHEVNRLVPYARPMIFGIDDALIAAVAGPVLSSVVGPLVNALPQLVNAANQQKLARQALTDKQVSDLLSEVNRTMLMQQLISAQNMPVNPGIASSDMGALASLLQAAATTAAPAGTPAVARPASVEDHRAPARPSPIASKALLTMVTGPAVTRLGAPRVMFVREQTPVLRFRLDVGKAGPAIPLPRAILQICVREPGGAHDLLQRSERLTGSAPGSEIAVRLTAQEFGALPSDTDLEVLACLRWPGRRGTYQATCSQTIVVASRVQVRDRGDLVGSPVELTDMNRYRSFWNKVWSSPDSGAGDEALPLWGLDVAMRYSVVLTPGQQGNALMETRLQEQPGEPGLRASTRGRLKSGIEVGVAELNKLLPLWPGEQPLSAEDAAAFTASGWRAGQGGDAVTEVRMEGKRRTRGQLWAVPVLKLRTFTLATAGDVDPYGQVTATQDRSVHFPVVESIRVLGLSSMHDGGEPGEAADVGSAEAPAAYRFDGYDVVLNQLVGLDPAQPLPRGRR